MYLNLIHLGKEVPSGDKQKLKIKPTTTCMCAWNALLVAPLNKYRFVS